MKKIRPSHKITIATFLILFVALEFLLWAIFGTKWWRFEGNYIHERLWIDLLYTGIAVLCIGVAIIIYISKVYYIVDKNGIMRHGNKMCEYRFNDIVYIDEEYTKKHLDMKFYMNTGKWVFLTMDPDKEIYNIIKEKSHHILDLDTFKIKYPEAIK